MPICKLCATHPCVIKSLWWAFYTSVHSYITTMHPPHQETVVKDSAQHNWEHRIYGRREGTWDCLTWTVLPGACLPGTWPGSRGPGKAETSRTPWRLSARGKVTSPPAAVRFVNPETWALPPPPLLTPWHLGFRLDISLPFIVSCWPGLLEDRLGVPVTTAFPFGPPRAVLLVLGFSSYLTGEGG